MVSNFRQSGWKVLSMDLVANTEANSNVIVDPAVAMKQQASSLVRETMLFSRSFDSIIIVAGGFGMGSIKDPEIFEQWELQDRINF